MSNYFKPKLKSIVEYCRIEGKIYFFNQPGTAIEMEDPSGFIELVCKCMDGKLTFNQIQNSLSTTHPYECLYLESLLGALDDEYLLEDVVSNYPSRMNDHELERWSRNIEFFGSHCKANNNKFSFQEKLTSTKVVIFGLGGVGSNVLYQLSALGINNITAVDFDIISLSNLNRQIIYHETDIGQFKTDIAKNRISEFYKNSKLNFITKKISSSVEIENIIVNHDFVIVAIDDPRDKIIDWFNVACINQNIPFLCGSLDSKLVMCYTIIPQKTGCVECWKISQNSTNLKFHNIIQQPNFINSKSPNIAIMPLISILTGLMTNEFLKIITGIGEPQSLGQLYTFNFITSNISISEQWKINPSCPVCKRNQ